MAFLYLKKAHHLNKPLFVEMMTALTDSEHSTDQWDNDVYSLNLKAIEPYESAPMKDGNTYNFNIGQEFILNCSTALYNAIGKCTTKEGSIIRIVMVEYTTDKGENRTGWDVILSDNTSDVKSAVQGALNGSNGQSNGSSAPNWDKIAEGKVRHGVCIEAFRKGLALDNSTANLINDWTQFIMTGELQEEEIPF